MSDSTRHDPGAPPNSADEHATRGTVGAAPPGSTAHDHQVSELTAGADGDLNVRCPSCHVPQGLDVNAPFSDLTCGSCGSKFSLTEELTKTFGGQKISALGHFELIEQLGMGAFGAVWKARDKELDRIVAIKVPRRESMDEQDIDKFFREARAAAQLQHPNIVSVHEVGREGDTIFIVSDFVHGITLGDWLTGQRVTARESAEICALICDALEHAHERGVIHRDLKPANVMMDSACQPYLMDFGLAKRERGEVTMTVEGQILGTPAYMSPEQASGQGHWIDRRSDIYSMAVMLFRMLTDELPFRGNMQSQIFARQNEDAPDPRSLNRTIPRDMATICLRCLERDPNRRYATAADVAEELRRFLRGEPVKARPITRIERFIRWVGRKPAQATAAGLVALLAVVGPSAAAFIETQRGRLAQSLKENQGLIKQLSDEKQADAERIDGLRRELDLWEGRADPWNLWPPKGDTPPRKAALDALALKLQTELDRLVRVGGLDKRDDARCHWALAELAQATGRPDDAKASYLSAARRLEALVADDPADSAATAALAEAQFRLADLAGDDSEEAARRLAKGAELIDPEARGGDAAYRERIAWVDAKMREAVLTGMTPEGQQTMAEAKRAFDALRDGAPTDARVLYRLVAYLTRSEALLDDSRRERSE